MTPKQVMHNYRELLDLLWLEKTLYLFSKRKKAKIKRKPKKMK